MINRSSISFWPKYQLANEILTNAGDLYEQRKTRQQGIEGKAHANTKGKTSRAKSQKRRNQKYCGIVTW